MAEKKEVIVKYKKYRHPRSIKNMELDYLYDAMQRAVEVKYHIEALANAKEVAVEDMDITGFQPDLVWQLADAVTICYQRLLKEALINTANISKIQPTLN